VKRFLATDAFKVLVYCVATFVLAALLTPWIYNVGQFLADYTEKENAAGLIEYLGEHAGRADFSRFFKRALVLAALLLLFPLILSVKTSRPKKALKNTPWADYIPDKDPSSPRAQKLRWKTAIAPLDFFFGLLVSGPLLIAIGHFLIANGYFEWDEAVDWGRSIRKALTAAVGASLLEEWIFRGLLLGLFLKSFRSTTAIVSLSIVFSALHFLQPPSGLAIENPGHPLAGFELLKLIALRFLEFPAFFNEFLSLFALGLILGYARFRTASLWLPIGLHFGWVFAFKLFNGYTNRVVEKSGIMVGSDLKEGLIPMIAIVLTAALVWWYLKGKHPQASSSE